MADVDFDISVAAHNLQTDSFVQTLRFEIGKKHGEAGKVDIAILETITTP